MKYPRWSFFAKILSASHRLTIAKSSILDRFFFFIWVLFHKHSRITGLQGKGEGIPLTPHYRHLDISWTITAETSPLDIANSRTQTGHLWFPSASC